MIMMMHDAFVHYHAFPRYDKVVNLFDIEWKDNNTLTNFRTFELLDDELLFKIDELDYLNKSDSDEMKTTRALVQTIIDIFNKKTNNGNNKGYQKK